jgi:hypothetical protein
MMPLEPNIFIQISNFLTPLKHLFLRFYPNGKKILGKVKNNKNSQPVGNNYIMLVCGDGHKRTGLEQRDAFVVSIYFVRMRIGTMFLVAEQILFE